MSHNTHEMSDVRLGLLMLSSMAFVAYAYAVIIAEIPVPM